MRIDAGERNRLILFVKMGCQFCQQAIDLVAESVGVEVLVYHVFQSRVEGRAEIRPYGVYENTSGIPLLVDVNVVDEVPMLYDPILDDHIYGMENIQNYFDEFLSKDASSAL